MENINIIQFTDKISVIVGKNNDLIGAEADSLTREYGIDSSEAIGQTLAGMENKERLLQIGIIGRVKSGKSSLLNALIFNGQAVLPKAATPMTAALTVLSYGEKLSAEVELFSKKDLSNIEENSNKYKAKLKELTKKKIEELSKDSKRIKTTDAKINDIEEKANRQALRELKDELELSAAYEQFEKIKRSGINIDTLGDKRVLQSKDLSELSETLIEYVGAEGKYMPFTKSVHIKLPLENLKDIQVIDTPGINDPVQSREERTRELLKYCDVVFIVSPSGQFLSCQDTDLMDRITTKEGIRELFVISSLVDSQLFGSEKERFNGDLNKILEGITADLGGHLSSSLTNLKKNNPEVEDTFDQLIEQGKDKVIHSSGICQTIKLLFDERDKWDSGVMKVWENLTKHYPDYFTDEDKKLSFSSLDLLANISNIEAIIAKIRMGKDEILKKRKEEFIQAKYNSLINYKKALISYSKEQADRIKSNNVEVIIKQKANLEKGKKKAALALDEAYKDQVNELSYTLKNKLVKTLNSYFEASFTSVNEAEGTGSEKYQIDKGSGFLWWRDIVGNRYETHTRTYTTVRTGAIRTALTRLTSNIETTISNQSIEFILEWRKNLYSILVKTLRDNINDDDLEPNLIRNSIRNILNLVEYPDINYSGDLPVSLNATNTLRDSSAENFISAAQDYISNLRKRVNDDINSYIKRLITNLSAHDPSTKIFENYKEKIEQLEEQIKYKEITIESLARFIKELEKVDGNEQ